MPGERCHLIGVDAHGEFGGMRAQALDLLPENGRHEQLRGSLVLEQELEGAVVDGVGDSHADCVLRTTTARSTMAGRIVQLGRLLARVFAGDTFSELTAPFVLVAAVIVLRGWNEHTRAMIAHRTAVRVQLHCASDSTPRWSRSVRPISGSSIPGRS